MFVQVSAQEADECQCEIKLKSINEMLENGFLISINRLGNCFFLSQWSVQAAGDKNPTTYCLYLLQFSPKTIINCQSVSFGDWREHSKLYIFSRWKNRHALNGFIIFVYSFHALLFPPAPVIFSAAGTNRDSLIDAWTFGRWFSWCWRWARLLLRWSPFNKTWGVTRVTSHGC